MIGQLNQYTSKSCRALLVRFLVTAALVVSAVGIARAAVDENKQDQSSATGKGGGVGGGGGGGPPAAKVRLAAADMRTVEVWREVTGEMRAARRSIIAAQERGLVEKIAVDAGDSVRAGELIAEQDAHVAKIEVARTTANLSIKKAVVLERQAALEKAQRDFRLISDSFQRSGASENERDDAATAVASAEARLEEAKADVEAAQAERDRAQRVVQDMSIAAPFSGTVVRKLTEIGQWLSAGDPVVELVQIDQLDAWLDVPAAVLERIDPKLFNQATGAAKAVVGGELMPEREVEVIVRVDALPVGEREIRAKVAGIVPAGDPLSRLFPVRVRVDNSLGKIRPGMSIVALVPTGQPEEALTVSRDAVMRSQTGTFVYFDAGGVAGVAPVEIRFAYQDRMVVSSPILKPGMMVVIEGNERLFPGQTLLNTESGKP